MKILLFILIIALFGCSGNSDSTECCTNHDGVVMCYRPTGSSHGHIMCRDGYTCSRGVLLIFDNRD